MKDTGNDMIQIFHDLLVDAIREYFSFTRTGLPHQRFHGEILP